LDEKLRRQTIAMACSLVSLVDLRDSYTAGHSGRVAQYSAGAAMRLELDDAYIQSIVFAGLLHDIGKIGVPDHILMKRGPLDGDESGLIRRHPEFGWTAIANVDDFEEIGLMVLHHHERFDGTGYPSGLAGDDIPIGARIIAVADVYDALTSMRPYRQAQDSRSARREIQDAAGADFDPRVVAAFLDHLGK
jgi:HD-GYP domain-containing protein (c-di-GMP phosphodiesterase class II)